MDSKAGEYDVIVVGGALSGASTALLLKRRDPALRVLVVERSTAFGRRVGESTVEISSYFLGRVLGLTGYLNQEHIAKQGMRFWFYNDKSACIDSCSEIGPPYNVRLATYQVDRARLDEHVLKMAAEAGAEILRPAEVKAIDLQPGGQQTVTLKQGDGRWELRARWVVDASGPARLLARKNDWVRRNTEHPVSSVWSRWSGVRCLDDPELQFENAAFAGRCLGTRHTATNHLIGKGWWAWIIPLKGGDTSIGVVYDERLVELPEGDNPADRMRKLLLTHPTGGKLLAEAAYQPDDINLRRNLPYWSERMAGDGFALVGDAGAFLDPFYSPGMDWIAFSASSAAGLIAGEAEDKAEAAEQLDAQLQLSYRRWFQAIYQDKYFYMGDFELMGLAFLLDFGFYYFGVVSQPYKHGPKALETPAFARPGAGGAFTLIRAYNRRLAKIGEARMLRGIWGRNNDNRFFPFDSYNLNWRLGLRLVLTLLKWVKLELLEGWRSWGAPAPGTRPAQAEPGKPPVPKPIAPSETER